MGPNVSRAKILLY